MKKILLVLFPFVAFAQSSYEIYPSKECEALKDDYTAQIREIQNVNGSQRVNLLGLNQQLTGIRSFGEAVTNIQDQARGTDFDFQSLSSAYSTVAWANDSLETVSVMLENNSTNTYKLGQLLTSVQNIDCGKCGSDSTNCCDFTQIIDAINEVSDEVYDVYIELYNTEELVGQVIEWLEEISPTINIGFSNTTNILASIQNVVTNLIKSTGNFASVASDKFTYLKSGNSLNVIQRDWWSNLRYSKAFSPITYGTLTSMYQLDFNNFLQLSSLNNYFYDFEKNHFPVLTNTVGAIHRDTTNFFSFFRGEIGVNGVLEDWTNEESDGTYHDFLTNHYINVVRGGSLSGNTSSKTNWFSRIETLLASLVFLDSANTNSYNEAAASVSNSMSRVKDDFNSTFDGVSSASSTQMELVSDIEKSMYESLRSFSQAFSSASLPSSVRLLYVYKTSGSRSLSLSSDTVDVTVPVEGKLMDFVEIMRSASTLCWVFFGLWFMFKFSVWTVKKIYVLIRYIIDFFNMVAGGK